MTITSQIRTHLRIASLCYMQYLYRIVADAAIAIIQYKADIVIRALKESQPT